LRRILLIDDTPEIAELLTYALRDRGFDVYATGFTTSVNELIAEQRAEALVIDCTLYNMSESIFDSVREDPAHAQFPVVIISDTPEEADKSLQSKNAESVFLIPKPFTGAQVARALEELFK
jgi:DNA-binding response OmpR family regulator